jgi:predicted enzyme related to lactoylglutathione lyase
MISEAGQEVMMAGFHGRFLWYELVTADADGAQRFYKDVVGWKTERFPNPSMRYDLWLTPDGGSVGGLMTLPDQAAKAGLPPHWLTYVGTPELERTLAKATSLGAKVLTSPSEIPDVGRIVVLADPQGASFALYQPSAAPGAEAPPQPGQFSWHELATTDPAAAFAFYARLFGWVETSAMDMGELGVYQMFGRRADAPLGGIYKKPAEMQGPSAWLPYALVKDVKAAAKRIGTGGGQVVNGPMEVPGGDWIVMAVDPQGAVFALHHRAPAAAKAPAAKKPARRKSVAKKKPVRKKAVARKKAVRRRQGAEVD